MGEEDGHLDGTCCGWQACDSDGRADSALALVHLDCTHQWNFRSYHGPTPYLIHSVRYPPLTWIKVR